MLLLFILKKDTNVFSSLSLSSLPVSKQAVLGVSETVDNAEFSNDRLIKILEVIEVDSVHENEKAYSQNELQNSMKVLMNEPSIKSKSSYTEAIARELDDKNAFKGRIAVVKQGDTLSSLSQKYYGDSKMFSRIIKANKNIINGNNILRIGESINIPN